MSKATVACLMLLVCAAASAGGARDAAAELGVQDMVLKREPVAVWRQQPDLVSGGAYTSSLRLSDGYWSEAADDFEIPYSATVDAIEWWGAHDPPEDLVYVIVRFYLDDQTLGRSTPGAVAYQETIYVLVGEEITGPSGSDYRYTADLPLPFAASAANRYWISIQGVEQNSQWYWYESPADGYWGEAAVIRSDFWGYPDWAPYSELVDHVRAFSFVLYADSTPVEVLSWGAVKALYR